MSKAKYWQQGDSLDFRNSGDEMIETGSIVSLVSRIGIAGTNIGVDEVGSVVVTGVFEMEKTDTTEIPMGTLVYFDGTGITATADKNVPAGYAADASSASDETVKVKLLG